MRWVLVLALACAPAVDGPVEQQRAIDRDDGDRLAAQLAVLPGAVHAAVTLHRPVMDPLGHDVAGSAAIVIVVDDKADRAAITSAATQLAHATAPEIPAPAIVVALGEARPELAKVGPFDVAAGSRTMLKATFAVLLAIIVALAAWLAKRSR